MPGRQKKPTLRSQPLPRQEVNVTIQHLPEEQHQQQHNNNNNHNHNRITNIHYV
jgi:hypothetical protein